MSPRRTLLAALVALHAAGPVAAQAYRSEEVDRSLRSRRQIAIRTAKDASPDPDSERQLRAYFENYHLPAMTQATPEGLEDLEKLRVDLFKQLIYSARGGTQRYLSEEAKKYALRVVSPKSNYHPAVTYNFLLVLGLIDDTYAGGSGQTKPDAKANEVLCKLAGLAATRAQQPNYLLLGALIGLERHTLFFASLPEKNQTLTIRTLGSLLTLDQLAGEYDDGVRDWVYLKAARALSNLDSVGPKGAFFKAVAKRFADETLEDETRAELAALIAEMKPAPGQVPAGPIAGAFVDFAASVAKQERETMERFENLQLRGGSRARTGTSGGGRDKSVRRYRVEDDRVALVREGLLKLLTDLRTGAETLAPLAEGDAAAKLTAIVGALAPAIEAVGDKDVIDLNVAEAVKQAARSIEALTGGAAIEDDDLGF